MYSIRSKKQSLWKLNVYKQLLTEKLMKLIEEVWNRELKEPLKCLVKRELLRAIWQKISWSISKRIHLKSWLMKVPFARDKTFHSTILTCLNSTTRFFWIWLTKSRLRIISLKSCLKAPKSNLNCIKWLFWKSLNVVKKKKRKDSDWRKLSRKQRDFVRNREMLWESRYVLWSCRTSSPMKYCLLPN